MYNHIIFSTHASVYPEYGCPSGAQLVVADHLITPVIFRTNLLCHNELIINKTFRVYPKQVQAPQQELQSLWQRNCVTQLSC